MTFATLTSGGPAGGGGALPHPSANNRLNPEAASMVSFRWAFIFFDSRFRQARQPPNVTVPPDSMQITISGRDLFYLTVPCFAARTNRPIGQLTARRVGYIERP